MIYGYFINRTLFYDAHAVPPSASARISKPIVFKPSSYIGELGKDLVETKVLYIIVYPAYNSYLSPLKLIIFCNYGVSLGCFCQ
jgi:hypothetical protein